MCFSITHILSITYGILALFYAKFRLKRLLDAFGIVVIPDGLGGFEHNAALHLLGRDGRLVLIGDIDQHLAFADQAARW